VAGSAPAGQCPELDTRGCGRRETAVSVFVGTREPVDIPLPFPGEQRLLAVITVRLGRGSVARSARRVGAAVSGKPQEQSATTSRSIRRLASARTPLGHASQKHVLGAAGPACTDDNDVGRPALGRAEQPFERAPGHEHRLHRPAGGPEHIRCAVHETLTGALLLDVNFAANPAPRCANFGGHQAQRGHTRRIQDVHDSDVAAGRARTHGLVQFADPERGGAHSPLIGGALCDPRGVPPEPTDIVPGAARPPVWAPRKGTKTRLPTWRDNCHTRAVGSCWRRRREVTQVLPPAGIAAARRPPLRSPFGHLAPRRARA
jgi:hypothetical protein